MKKIIKSHFNQAWVRHIRLQKNMISFVRACWVLVVALLVMSAIYISLARHFVPLMVPTFKEDIENRLTATLKHRVTIQSLEGRVVGFNPEILVHTVHVDDETQVEEIILELDVIKSLLFRSIRFSNMVIKKATLHLTQESGGWRAGELFFPNNQPSDLTWVNYFEDVQLIDSDIQITPIENQTITLNSSSVQLNQSKDKQQLIAEVMMPNKQPAKVVAEADGRWSNAAAMDWKLYLKIPTMDLLRWIPHQSWIKTAQLDCAGEVWIDWENSVVSDVRLRVEAPLFSGQLFDTSETETFNSIIAELIYKKTDDGFSVAVPTFSFMRKNQFMQLGGWALTQQLLDQREMWLLHANEINLESWMALLTEGHYLPLGVEEALVQLQPIGKLKNTKAKIYLNNHRELIDFEANADTQGLGIRAWNSIPSVSGVDGQIIFTKQGGQLRLNSNHFALNFPEVFDNGWKFTRAEGQLYWSYDDQRFLIRGDQLSLANDVAQTLGEFEYVTPFESSPTNRDHLSLRIGFENVDGRHRMDYIPEKEMDPELVNWLGMAIVRGNVSKGAYLYDGSTDEDDMNYSQQVALNVENAEIKFEPNWPTLKDFNGSMIYNNDGLRVITPSAKLLDADLQDVQVVLPALANTIRVTGQAHASNSTVLELFKTTPLRAELGNAFDTWKATGSAQANLLIDIPLSNQATQVDINAQIMDAQFTMPNFDLVFDEVNGRLAYNTQKGLSSPKLTAIGFNQPLTFTINTSEKDPQQKAIIKTQASLSVDQLKSWKPSSLWQYMSGSVAGTVQVQIPLRRTKTASPPLLMIHSSLQGLAVGLPQPFGKKSNQVRNTTFKINFADEFLLTAAVKNPDFVVTSNIPQANQRVRTHIQLGGGESVQPLQDGLRVTGSMANLSADEWIAFINQENKKSKDVSSSNPDSLPIHIDIQAAQLNWGDQTVQGLGLTLNHSQDAWMLGLQSDTVRGVIEFPDNRQLPYEVMLDSLNLPESSSSADPEQDPLAKVSPADLPAMQVKIASFQIGSKKYGKWYFNVVPKLQGVDIQNLQVENMNGLNISGAQGGWTIDKKSKQMHTQISGQITSSDFGQAMQAWGYETGIQSQKTDFDFNLTWPASPALPLLSKSNGHLAFDFEKGQLTDVGGKANVLKIFGVLNLSAFTKRLMGDFSDLYKSGISFDEMKGKLTLQDGIATFSDPMKITGPSSNFVITGTTNMKTGELNQEITVTPPIGQNATIIATVLCGPACGGITYLIQKLGNEQINQFSSLKYRMTGTYDNPQLDKETIFNQSSR